MIILKTLIGRVNQAEASGRRVLIPFPPLTAQPNTRLARSLEQLGQIANQLELLASCL